jgi:hypothetical protein
VQVALACVQDGKPGRAALAVQSYAGAAEEATSKTRRDRPWDWLPCEWMNGPSVRVSLQSTTTRASLGLGSFVVTICKKFSGVALGFHSAPWSSYAPTL